MTTYDDIDRATRADAARDRVVRAAMKYKDAWMNEKATNQTIHDARLELFAACRELKEVRG